jgi:hypothetical protein
VSIALLEKKLVDHYQDILQQFGQSRQKLKELESTDASIETLKAFCSNLLYNFSELQHEIIRNKHATGEFIAEQISNQALDHYLPPPFLSKLHTFFLEIVQIAKTSNEVGSRNLTSEAFSCCYHVFHGGEYRFYFGKLPDEILKLKESVLFWIDKANNEFLSLAKTVPKESWLDPKARELLKYLCSRKISGKHISLEDINHDVWYSSSSASSSKMRNTFSVAANKINTFALEKFISEDSNKYVQRLRGQDQFMVSARCADAICIINCTPVKEKNNQKQVES